MPRPLIVVLKPIRNWFNPQLLTLSVVELRTLWLALANESGLRHAQSSGRGQNRPQGARTNRTTFERSGRRVSICLRLENQIERLYHRSRKNTAVHVALEQLV